MKKELMQALLADSELVGLVGRTEGSNQPSIFFNSPLAHCTFPVVSFFEKGGGDAVFADDVCIIKTVIFQLDIWAELEISRVCDRVCEVVRLLGYRTDGIRDVPDPNIEHIELVISKLV